MATPAEPDVGHAGAAENTIALPEHATWSSHPIANWLVEHGGREMDLGRLLQEVCQRLLAHGVPLYVAAPTSTIDLTLPTGDAIPLEQRSTEEVTHLGGVRVAAEGVRVLNAAFDITPHDYVAAIITERGVVREPYDPGLRGRIEEHRG